MKPMKLLVVSALVGVSIFSFAACQKDPKTVTVNDDGVETRLELNKESIPAKPQDPVKEGWIFRGWFLDPAGNTPYNFDKALDAGSTVYAVFDEKEYQVTFVVDGVSDVVTFKWSQTPTYPTPKKDKYIFKTWCLDPTLTQDYAFTAPTTSGMTVYAKFVDAYKVQYAVTPNLDTTEEIETEIVETEKETAPVRPADPRVEGYDFEGWYLDKKLTQEYNFDTVLAEGQTVYAKLVEKQYKITYKAAKTGDVLSTITYNYWDVPAQPETPEYQGEWFFGWYLDSECTNSYDFSYTLKEDTVVYAQFMETKYIYTFDELQAIKDYPANNYTLMNNIVLGTKIWSPVEEFSGTFDGNGYQLIAITLSFNTASAGFIKTNSGTIKNLTLMSYSFVANYTNGSYVAGALVATNKGTIENCRLDDINIFFDATGSGTSYLGAIVGVNEKGGVIKNCWTNAKVEINNHAKNATNTVYVGGIVGQNAGLVQDVFVETVLTAEVSSNGYYNYSYDNRYSAGYLRMGGIVGQNSGVLTKSHFESKMTAVAYKFGGYNDTYIDMGGLVQSNEKTGQINECYCKGSIIEQAGSYAELSIGGFVEYNAGVIRDCYSDMDITTATTSVSGRIGGFVAENVVPITTCYSTGSITSGFTGYIGGFIAQNGYGSTVNLCFASVDITATQASKLGAFVGQIDDGSMILICRYNNEAIILKNGEAYTSPEVAQVVGLTAAELYSSKNILNTLYWNIDYNVWVVSGEKAPTLYWEPVSETEEIEAE